MKEQDENLLLDPLSEANMEVLLHAAGLEVGVVLIM